MEKWLTIRNHPDYEVNNLGDVRNKKTNRILKPQLNRTDGYYRVALNGKRYYVHRLVADAFFDGDHDKSGMVYKKGEHSARLYQRVKIPNCSAGSEV